LVWHHVLLTPITTTITNHQPPTTNYQPGICTQRATGIAITNGDFEQNPHGNAYTYMIPAGWSRDMTNSVIAMNGNGA